MAYPIQPTVIKNSFGVRVYDDLGVETIVTDNVTSVRGFRGAEPDKYFTQTFAGSFEVEVYDSKTYLDAETFFIGQRIDLYNTTSGTGNGYTLFQALVSDVSSEYVRDPKTSLNVFVTTITAIDTFAQVSSDSRADYQLFTGTAETQLLSDFLDLLTTQDTGLSAYDNAGTGSETINQFVAGGSIPEIVRRASIGADMFEVYGNGITKLYPVPTAASVTPTWFLTDGTQSSVPSGTTRIDYTEVEYSRDPHSCLSKVTLNNYGLNRAPQSTSDKTVNDIVVPFSQSQTIGYENAVEFDSAVATNNLGWNLVQEDGTGRYAPQNWGSSNVGTWRFTRPSMSSASYLGDHGVVRAKCLPSGGVAANAGFLLGAVDPDYDFVTSVPGGATGAWTAQVKVRAINTSRTLRLNIAWYDNDGVNLGYTTGTNTSVPTGSWTTLTTTTTSPPAGAVTAVPALFTNAAIAQYGMYYITELYLGRAGTSSTFFNGDTDDTSSYTYTWTGERFKSPSQKNTNTIDTYAAKILARHSQKYPIAKSVVVNFTQSLAYSGLFKSMLIALDNAADLRQAYVCVNNSTLADSKYLVCGIDFELTPTTAIAKLNLIHIPQ